jgi:FMN-dependent NADH-azoreductase
MKTLLQLNTSLFSSGGQSSTLAERFVAAWRRENPTGRVITRDLAKDPVPHITAERFGSFTASPEARTPEQRAVVAYSDALIAELKAADTIVIGLPMYNFGIPSTLKAYFDHVARAGVTFTYSDKGPAGLLTGKNVVVFATRGGAYAGTPKDTETPYVRDFLRFLGMDDVEFVYAEGLAMGDANRDAAIAGAHAEIARITSRREVAYAA